MDKFFDNIFDFFNNIMQMMSNLWNFLFSTITIGTWQFQPFYLIIGSTFVLMLGSWLFGKVLGWIG